MNDEAPQSGWRVIAIERALNDMYSALVALVVINVCWLLLSLTIILMPPATAGLYAVAVQARRGQGPYLRDYLAAVRRYLLPGWAWGVVTLALAFVCGYAIAFYSSVQAWWGSALLTVSVALTLVACLVQFYVWPYMVLQEQPRLLLAARNALFTLLGDPWHVLFNVAIALFITIPGMLLIAPFILIVPVCVAYLGTYSLYGWLAHHGQFGRQ